MIALRLHRTLRAAALAVLLFAPVAHVQAQAQDVVVFAAASLKTALDAVAKDWAAQTGDKAAISYAASSALAKQIESGAPADLFVSADLDWMDYLAERQLIDPATRANLLGNRLVLVATGPNAAPIAIAPNFDLAGALGGGRLAVGEVTSVPAGRYAKAALTALGVWPSVAGSLAQADNVRAALVLVSRGEAPLGIVYATDAKADPGVSVVGVFAQDSHPPIVYPIALTAASTNPHAKDFLAYIRSPAAAAVFEAQGFTVLK